MKDSLLDPDKIRNYPPPLARAALVGGKAVSYVLEGAVDSPVILYFHGWGVGPIGTLRREYPLIEAGYRLLIPYRPGYNGTALTHGKSADDTARMANGLLDHLGLETVPVIATSGGAPSALAFAARYPARVKRLILQAAVTHPWTEAVYVTPVFRWAFGFTHPFGKEIPGISKTVFTLAMISKLRSGAKNGGGQLYEFIIGPNLAEVKEDPAFQPFMETTIADASNKANAEGRKNDGYNILLTDRDYFDGSAIRCPVLIIHDPDDPFVPFAHAEYAARQIKGAELYPLHAAGHFVWLGRDAPAMHQRRLAFLQASVS